MASSGLIVPAITSWAASITSRWASLGHWTPARTKPTLATRRRTFSGSAAKLWSPMRSAARSSERAARFGVVAQLGTSEGHVIGVHVLAGRLALHLREAV